MKNNDIIHTNNLLSDMNDYLMNFRQEKKLIITDKNCKEHCFPKIKEITDNSYLIYELSPGEENKSIKNVTKIWELLSQNEFTRQSLIINLGGGMVSDLGGFAASTFKRGMPYINIPTTVLAQADASSGGKTGINFLSLKNEIGVFNQAEKVFISDIFLETLSDREFLSGYAEMIKHALISNEEHLDELFEFYESYKKNKSLKGFKDLMIKSVNIKKHFVKSDPFDRGKRKILNFGHTFGHAFESHFNLKNDIPLKHGEAVAAGMICELYISFLKAGLNENKLKHISKHIFDIYDPINISQKDYINIFELMLHDKKNHSGVINCVLISNTGEALFDQKIEKSEIIHALKYLNNLKMR